MRKVFLFFSMPVSLGQYRGTVGMFNNIFANKRCNKNSICYRRKMQSSEFGLTMILLFLLHAFPTLIGFLKKIARQNMLIVHINKKFLISCFYLFLDAVTDIVFGYFRDWCISVVILKKIPGPLKDFSQTFSIGHWNLNNLIWTIGN